MDSNRSTNEFKNTAVSRNLAESATILQNENRWPGKYAIVSVYNKVGEELINGADSEHTNLTID